VNFAGSVSVPEYDPSFRFVIVLQPGFESGLVVMIVFYSHLNFALRDLHYEYNSPDQ
jgi:hypothetical protein